MKLWERLREKRSLLFSVRIRSPLSLALQSKEAICHTRKICRISKQLLAANRSGQETKTFQWKDLKSQSTICTQGKVSVLAIQELLSLLVPFTSPTPELPECCQRLSVASTVHNWKIQGKKSSRSIHSKTMGSKKKKATLLEDACTCLSICEALTQPLKTSVFLRLNTGKPFSFSYTLQQKHFRQLQKVW